MPPSIKALPLLFLLAYSCFAQGTPVDCTPQAFTFTTATTGAVIPNSNSATPCVSWRVTYNSTGFSALSIQIETSPDNSSWTAVTNTVCSSSVQPPCVIDGANPTTTTTNATFSVRAYGRYVRLNVTSVTGSGTITARVLGYKGLSANAGGGTGGGGSGTVTSVTIAGTANQIAVSGTCTGTTIINCTLAFLNASVTLDSSGNFSTPGTVSTGSGGGTNGKLTLSGGTSGSAAITVAAAAGTPNDIALPTTTGSAGTFLQTDGASPQQTSWASAYQTIDSNGSAVTKRPTVNFISGTNATVTCVDNGGSTRTDCTIAATAGSATPVFPVNAQTGTYQLLAADFSNFKTIAVASGTFTITGVASGSQPASGTGIWIINYGTGVVTFARSGQNINGNTASITIPAGSASAPTGLFVVSDGTNYIAQTLGGTSGGGTTVTAAPPYLTVSGTVYCGPLLTPCTIPTACNSGWTWTLQNSGTCTTNANGDLFFVFPAQGADNLTAQTRSVGGTFTLIAAFDGDWMPSSTTGQMGLGLVVTDGTKFITFELTNLDGQTGAPSLRNEKWNTSTSAGANYNNWQDNNDNGGSTAKKGNGIFWLKLVLDSTNLTWSYSINGTNYTQFDQRAKGDFLGTITAAGVGGYMHTAGNMHLVSLSGI